MSSVRETPWGECLLERGHDPELVRSFKKATGGRPSGNLLYFLDVPWVARELSVLAARLTRRVHLDHDLADMVGLVVSQDNSCRYCFATQRAMMRVLGLPESQIEKLEHGLLLAEVEPPVRAALEYARRFSRANPLASLADAEPLREHAFSDEAIREIAANAALHTLFNRVSTIVSLPPYAMEELPDRWWIRALGPIAPAVVRRFRRRDPPESLRDEHREGPFSRVVVALDGNPVARELRAMLDALFASEVLTRRCKALAFAVIARALGCSHSGEEAAEMALGEGLSRDHLDRVLDHLDVGGLTPVESALVPFARETVWYDAPRLQASSRDLRAQLSKPEFVEAVATVAVSNAICRLTASLLRPAH